jgi:hypothetical protein
MDSGENFIKRQKHFFFEQQWLMEHDFLSSFKKMWYNNENKFRNMTYSGDFWHDCLCAAKQYLRGWNANKYSECKREKKEILLWLEEMDKWLESRGGGGEALV